MRIRNRFLNLKTFLRRRLVRICHFLAEYEACDLRPGERAKWRQFQLRHLGVTHGSAFYIGRGFWIQNGVNFSFGDRCSFGEFARIVDHGPIYVGDDFIAATGLQINSGTHDPQTMNPSVVNIEIGNRVWCGANVTIIAGAKIGDDVVIGAGSVVRSIIPSGSIIAGVPARVIRPLERKHEIRLWTWAQ